MVMLRSRRTPRRLVMLVALFLAVFFLLFRILGPAARSPRAFGPRPASLPLGTACCRLRRAASARTSAAGFFLLGLFAFALVFVVLVLAAAALFVFAGVGTCPRAGSALLAVGVVLWGADSDENYVIVVAGEHLVGFRGSTLRRDGVDRKVVRLVFVVFVVVGGFEGFCTVLSWGQRRRIVRGRVGRRSGHGLRFILKRFRFRFVHHAEKHASPFLSFQLQLLLPGDVGQLFASSRRQFILDAIL